MKKPQECGGDPSDLWSPLARSLDLVIKATRSRKRSIEFLRQVLSSGKVSARCSSMSTEWDFNPLSSQPPVVGQRRHVVCVGEGRSVPSNTWINEARSRYNRSLLKWEKSVVGLMVSAARLSRDKKTREIVIRPGQRWVYYGVELSLLQLRAELVATFAVEFELKPKNVGSVIEKRRAAVKALYLAAARGDLNNEIGHPLFDSENDKAGRAAVRKSIRQCYHDHPDDEPVGGSMQRLTADLIRRHFEANEKAFKHRG